MRTWMLAAGAAALAITAPAVADPRGGGKGNAAKAERGGKDRGGQANAARRGGGERNVRAAQGDRRGSTQARAKAGQGESGARRARVEQREDRRSAGLNRGRDIRAERTRDNNAERRAMYADRNDDRNLIRDRARFAISDRRIRVRDFERGVLRVRDIDRDDRFIRRTGWVDGCPPGLAKKAVPCVPPGQAAKFVGQPLRAALRVAALDPLPRAIRGLYYDDDDSYYRYGGGYVYRVDRGNDLISSIIPLFGAALIGQQMQPYYANNAYRPSYFSSFYPNSPYDCYRYGYGYVYETDCASGLIEDVIPTYDRGYGVGQVLPASYGYYNLPNAYRGYYDDGDDYYYRYAPGAIYRVDRSTSLISAVAALLSGGLSVGQPLPTGYSSYNVPLAYRSSYFDTPDMWYRYNNGSIYSVDPTTQLVTAIVRAIV